MISAWLRGASKISRPTAGRWRRNRPSASFMVILESHVARLQIPAKAAKMGKRFDIGFLDGVLGFALVAQNAARDPVQAAVVPLHDGAERRVVPVKGPPDEFGIGGLGGDIWRGRYSHEGLPFTRLDAAAGERFPDPPRDCGRVAPFSAACGHSTYRRIDATAPFSQRRYRQTNV